MLDNHIYDHFSFGDSDFETFLSKKEYFMAHLNANLVSIGLAIVLVIVIALMFLVPLGFSGFAQLLQENALYEAGQIQSASFSVYLLGAFNTASGVIIALVWRASIYYRTRNNIYNNITIFTPSGKTLSMSSDLEFSSYIGLAISNGLWISCTLGLAWPLTKIRIAEHLSFNTTIEGDVDSPFESTLASYDEGSFGEEAGDLLDVTDGIGI